LILAGGSALAQGGPGAITAELAGLGAGTDGIVLAELPFRFDVRYTSLPDWRIVAMVNGFHVYSPDGATWQPIVCDSFSIGWPEYFDFWPFHVYYQGVTGSGADSFTVSAIATGGPGLENGFDGEVWYVSTKVSAADAGKTICLDSAWLGATNPWLWTLDGGGEYTPSWGGPYCYLIENAPIWSPGDGHKMHFPQLPDEDGWDCDMAWWPAHLALADDWQCSETGWVKSIHWWGAWWQGFDGSLDSLKIAIHKDTIGAFGVSQPGRMLWQVGLTDVQTTLMPAQNTPQNWLQPSSGNYYYFDSQAYYQFDVFLDEADWFWQEEGTVYWLALSTDAVDIYGTYLGWRSSNDHWGSPAIWGQFDDDWNPYPPLAEPPDWQEPLDMAFVVSNTIGSCCIPPLRGNVDYDPGDNVDISDLVYLVDHMFSGGPPPPCLAEADVDCSGGLDISDLVLAVDFMFTSGPSPCTCDCSDCP
jgi:hypothetical protein